MKVGSQLSSHFLKLQQGLTTIRIACSGGHVPLPDGDDGALSTKHDVKAKKGNDDGEGSDRDDEETEDDKEDDDGSEKKQKAKKIVRYSDFCYTSKMDKLIEELLLIRDNDPSGTIDWSPDYMLCLLTHFHRCLRSQKLDLFAVYIDPQVVGVKTARARFSMSDLVGQYVVDRSSQGIARLSK
jgi:hypothetical protein